MNLHPPPTPDITMKELFMYRSRQRGDLTQMGLLTLSACVLWFDDLGCCRYSTIGCHGAGVLLKMHSVFSQLRGGSYIEGLTWNHQR